MTAAAELHNCTSRKNNFRLLCISLRGISFHEAMYIGTIIVTGKYIHVVAYAAGHNQELRPSEEMFNNLKLFSWDSQVVKVTAPSL